MSRLRLLTSRNPRNHYWHRQTRCYGYSAAGNWGSLTTDQQAQFGQLMSNIHESLNNDALFATDAAILTDNLKIARSKGF